MRTFTLDRIPTTLLRAAVEEFAELAAMAGVDLDGGAHAGAQRRRVGRHLHGQPDRHALHHLHPVARWRSAPAAPRTPCRSPARGWSPSLSIRGRDRRRS